MATLKVASVLAFERKLANSDAEMFAGCWKENVQEMFADNAWQPISLQEKSVRGTISNRQKNAIMSDPAKLDQEVQKANLQTVDVAALPFDTDTLKVKFTLRVLGNLAIPSACNDPAYQEKLEATINHYIETEAFTELAYRYATNLANGRFLWRNRVGADAVCIRIQCATTGKEWVFDGLSFSLRNFSERNTDLAALSESIRLGLLEEKPCFLTVEAFVKIGPGQEVFPSQELILDDKSRKSKVLYHVNNIAAMHSQKIGNALRTIDDWYPNSDEFGPISVEPFGSVTSRGQAFRQPKQKVDFYTLFDQWVTKDKAPEIEQQHYVIATLIRGGVFGGKSE
ncbi:type I-F CRISPR-associated protein Csy3 [Marinibactrum halimedae]|uniref:CRISPR-associated protein Csy3 n=1 Tax=Marinibactrum halimedae TaxID=1444977 RepID=A0AA37TAL1_9GAMM|nr:type I-F CRISPR-associated protein Csy3 [Marinibactrum halimedae]MCD9460210.1 type I-F CRISPR-associated protein Csy3 [Marinibactrum halimedae]GLS27958.1 CRISPR-associated protein Csy3 [Marinibactrum halimedae]